MTAPIAPGVSLTPAFLNGLSDRAVAAYQAWSDSTLEKAEHILDCTSGCNDLIVVCPAGMLVAEDEVRLWGVWNGLRHEERAS